MLKRALLLVGLLGLAISARGQAPVSHLILKSNGNGGDCRRVGTWDGLTDTCTLNVDVETTIEFASPNVTLDCNGHSITGPSAAGFGSGVFLPLGSDGATVQECEVREFVRGILASQSHDHVISDNIVHDNTVFGIQFFDSSGNTVDRNEVFANGFRGLRATFADDTVISSNEFYDNQLTSLRVEFSNNLDIRDNIVRDGPTDGFGLDSVNDSLLENNVITGHTSESDSGGLTIFFCTGLTLKGNRMEGNRFNFAIVARGSQHYDHVIEPSNTVEGKPIYYLRDEDGTHIDPVAFPDAGAIYCIDCDDVTIEGHTFDANSGQAITLVGTEHSIVQGNTVEDYFVGVRGVESSHNVVRNNRLFVRGPFSFGIEFSTSFFGDRLGGDDNLVEANVVSAPDTFISAMRITGERYTIRDNTILAGGIMEVFSDGALIEGNILRNSGGIQLNDSASTVIRGNEIRDGVPQSFFGPAPFYERGITVDGSTGTVVAQNTITRMLNHGILLVESPGTLVFRNDIYDNALEGVDADGEELFEVWSDEAIELSDGVVAGNYWGRNCGQGNQQGGPLFQAGVDSNSIDVNDSFPFGHPVAAIPAHVPVEAGSCE